MSYGSEEEKRAAKINAASLSFLRSKNEREAVPLFFFMVLGGAENQFVLGSGAAENDKKK